MLNDYWIYIWNFKFSLAPVLVTYFFFELSTIVRRITRIAYTPIYFAFFPLGHADELYAQYFNEDDFYIGASQTPAEKNKVRKKIVSLSVVSMIFSTVVNPAMAGIFASIFLKVNEFFEFFVFLFILKLVMISFSLYRVRHVSFVYVSQSWVWLVAVYALYFALVMRVVFVSHEWGVQRIDEVGIYTMLLDIVDLILFDFGLYILAAGAVGAAVSYWMTDPDNIPVMEVVTEPELMPRED